MGTGSIIQTLLRITRRGMIWRRVCDSRISSSILLTAVPVRANKGQVEDFRGSLQALDNELTKATGLGLLG